MFKMTLKICLAGLLVLGLAATASAKNKFEEELEKEKEAVALVNQVKQGGYGLVTTEELKQWIDSGKDMVVVDTMPYEASYKENHVPTAVQFLFPIPDMNEWDLKETDGKTKEDYIKLLG